MRALALAVVPSVVLVARTAHAEAPAPSSADAAPPEPPSGGQPDEEPSPQIVVSRWYGWQTLIADGAAMSVVVSGIASESPGLMVAGAVTSLVAPPAVHIMHDRIGIGGVSFFIRLLAPPLLGYTAAFVGSRVHRSGDTFDSGGYAFTGAVVGVLLGWATAVVLDAAVFSHEKIKVQDRPSRATRRPPP